MKITKAIVFGGLMIGVVALLIVGVNLQSQVTVQQQTTATTNGVSTDIVKICNSNSPITVTALCQLSTNQGTTVINSPDCPNGGIPVDSICPSNVIPLPSNTVINTTQSTPTIPSSETIQLVAGVTETDNSGKTTVLQANSILLPLADLLPQLDLTAIHGTNVNISQGNIKISLVIQASPNEKIVGNGTFWVSVSDVQLHPMGLQWAVNGMTGTDGKITANIATPSGIISQYVFDIQKNAGILHHSTNQINFTVTNVQIQNAQGQAFKNANRQSVFNTLLDYDPNLTIITKSDGTTARVYPSDDTFTLSANPVSIHPYPLNISTCRSAGCVATQEQLANIVVTHLSVTAGTAKVYLEQNGTESLIGTTTNIGTSGSQTIKNIPRNADIKILVTDGQYPLVKTIHTPITQNSFSYTCIYTGCTFKGTGQFIAY